MVEIKIVPIEGGRREVIALDEPVFKNGWMIYRASKTGYSVAIPCHILNSVAWKWHGLTDTGS